MTVRTRTAPSPTGEAHLGTVYAALFNFAFARKEGGAFIVRIEDTDRRRHDPESEQAILSALRWMEIEWDEGPDIGGDYGPYRSSERLKIYDDHVEQLIECGGAFYCFCTADRLERVRREQQRNKQLPKYDGHCLGLTDSEVKRRIARGDPYVIRLKVPSDGYCKFQDGIRGAIEIPWSQVDMQVLRKSDGFPTYHLSATVDDRRMEISHVLRGEEWLSSVPKHQLICDYLGFPMPQLYHLPLLRNPDSSKISKRKNATGINYFKKCGFLPEALKNYLARMGWSMPDEREKFSFDEFVENFDLDRISPTGPVFDIDKLSWLNGQYIRDMSHEEFTSRFNQWLIDDNRVDRIVPLVQPRTERFDEVMRQIDYLNGDRISLSPASFEHKSLSLDDCKQILFFSQHSLELLSPWERDNIYESLNELAAHFDHKFRDFLFPLFVAISGRAVALPIFDSMAILGRDVAINRIRSAIDALGGISKKARKQHERLLREIQEATSNTTNDNSQ